MTIEEIFQDKSIKAKGKAKSICEWLISGELPMEELMVFSQNQSAINKATCIEAVECATRKTTDIADESLLLYVTNALMHDEPRVKWESAKVVGNIAKKFPNRLNTSIENLLNNTNCEGTVVRWATAYALGEILKLQTENNKALLPKIEKLINAEADNGVKKKYIDAMKKIKK